MKVVLFIPTLNPGKDAGLIAESLKVQTVQPDSILIVDSSSTDNSLDVFNAIGARVKVISRDQFDHGGTRNMAFDLADGDVYVFMTQDAILCNKNSIELLLSMFKDQSVGAVYGRQVQAEDATPIAAHARFYNYPDVSRVVSMKDASRLGVKAAFCSNSFAAYRKTAMQKVGFFPKKLIFGEDGYVAAKMLLAGWKVAYSADAQVIHSHNYTLTQELSRYFDLGVFHSVESWILDSFGRPEGEGMKFVKSEYSHLSKVGESFAGLKVLTRNGFRYIGYLLGKYHAALPKAVKLRLTMNRAYWRQYE